MGQLLFQIWILSFLFYSIDIVGTLSIDNLLLPVLVMAWLFVGDRRDARVNRARAKMVALATLVFFTLIFLDIAKLEGDASIAALKLPVMEHLKHYGYILVPLLYISSEKSLRWTLLSLLAVITINSGLAVLGALGVALPLVDARESTRIPGLLRARGPLVNDGDTALLISLMSLLIWTGVRHKIELVGDRFVIKMIILFVLFAGIIATQSRNVILTIAMIYSVYYWVRMTMQGEGGGRVILTITGIVAFLGVVTAVVLNADAIISWVTNMFGVSGEGTVRDRLDSYSNAIDLMQGSWLLGLSPEALMRNSMFVVALHNMWLGQLLFSGVFGVALVFSLIFFSLLGALQLIRDRDWKEYGFVLMSFILASLWFSPNFYPAHNAFIFWFCIGIGLTGMQTVHFKRQTSSQLPRDAADNARKKRNGKSPMPRILKLKSTSSS